MIDEASNVTIDDVNDIRSMTINKETGKSLFEGKTDDEVISHIKKQAEDARKKLDSYVKISNDLKTLYGDNISSDHLEELTWMMTQVDDWEGRTKSIINDVQSTIGSKAKEISDRFGVDVNTTLGNLEWMVNHLADDNNVVDEINKIIEDKNIPVEEGRARIEALIREKEMARRRHQEFPESMFSQIVALKDMLNTEEYQTMDPLSVKKISENLIDLIKLYSTRSKFISKYTQLAENPELFTAEAQ